jgi:hypothetical protein
VDSNGKMLIMNVVPTSLPPFLPEKVGKRGWRGIRGGGTVGVVENVCRFDTISRDNEAPAADKKGEGFRSPGKDQVRTAVKRGQRAARGIHAEKNMSARTKVRGDEDRRRSVASCRNRA